MMTGDNVDKSQSTGSIALVSGIWILFTLGLTLAVSAMEMLCGISVNHTTFPLAFVVSALMIFPFAKSRAFGISSVVVSSLWILTILIASFIPDYTCDGVWYHQESVFALFSGENFYLYPDAGDYNAYVRHYAKGFEIIEANIMALTGNIESGKAINIMTALSCSLILWKSLDGMSRILKTGLVFIVLSNPVFTGQMFTFYVDFAIYFFIILTVCFSVLLSRGIATRLSILGLAVTILLAVAVKFNSFFIEGVAVLAVLIWIWWKDGVKSGLFRTVFLTSAAAALVSALIICYHPYITNFITEGNPLYPLLGSGSIDIMTENTPDVYLSKNRFTSFLYSYFNIDLHNLLLRNDNRVGGFGFFSFLIFPISIMAIIFYAVKVRKVDVVVYSAICILVSCFFFEQSWWARYVPQLWLIVPLSYYALLKFKHAFAGVVGNLLLILSGITMLNSVTLGIFHSMDYYGRREAIHSVLKGTEHRVYDYDSHSLAALRNAGVNPIPSKTHSLDENSQNVNYYGYDRLMLIEVSERERMRIDEEIERRSVKSKIRSMFHK